MEALDVQPGAEWDGIQEQLNVSFSDELDVEEHYGKVVTLWECAQTYRDEVNALFEAEETDDDLQKYRRAAASAGEALRDAIGDGSLGVSKLCDMRDSVFRSINRGGESAMATSPDHDDEEVLDIIATGYRWVAEEMYVPAIQIARYEEDRLYTDQTLLERAWEAEEERIFQNRLEDALETIQNNPDMHSPESSRWAGSLLNYLRTQ